MAMATRPVNVLVLASDASCVLMNMTFCYNCNLNEMTCNTMFSGQPTNSLGEMGHNGALTAHTIIHSQSLREVAERFLLPNGVFAAERLQVLDQV